MISVVGLTNCKCFERLELPLKPLSLLCGLNGMGKSTVIQALLVLRQSFLSGELTAGRLVLGGDLADL
jgi:predicted ATPase